jgi:hypothetical protein
LVTIARGVSLRVAVVTPHLREPSEWFSRCLESVREQTIPCTHFVVDDGGDPCPEGADVERIALPRPHDDFGDTARAIGAISAIARGFDAIAWLDADNWYLPHHIETMLGTYVESGAAVVSSTRTLHHRDGRVLGPCYECDGQSFVDGNCLFVGRPGFGLIANWYLLDPKHHVIGDRVFWNAVVRSGLPHVHTGLPTVGYRTPYRVHYEAYGQEPPPNPKEQIKVAAPNLG